VSQPPSQDSNNPERQRREKDRDLLQEEWNLKHDRLAELRQSLVVETNAAVKFQLKKQIESDEEEIQDLEHKLYDLEKFLAGDIDSSAPSTSFDSNVQQRIDTTQSQSEFQSSKFNKIGCCFTLVLGLIVLYISIGYLTDERDAPSRLRQSIPQEKAPPF
jgi:hypothetical protein